MNPLKKNLTHKFGKKSQTFARELLKNHLITHSLTQIFVINKSNLRNLIIKTALKVKHIGTTVENINFIKTSLTVIGKIWPYFDYTKNSSSSFRNFGLKVTTGDWPDWRYGPYHMAHITWQPYGPLANDRPPL